MGQIKGRQIGCLKEIPALEVRKIHDPLAEQIASLEEQVDEFDSYIRKINAAINVLEK